MNFAREIWDDHDFWIKALAVKGGAGAIVIAGVMAIGHLVALPFLAAAVGIAFCVGLIAVGLYGIFLGILTIWDRLVEIYYRVFLHKPRKRKSARRKLLSQRLAENPRIRELLATPLLQKFLKSRAWKAARRITKKQEDIFLASLAMKGSIVSTIVGVSLIMTQILVLPVIAVGSVLTFTTLLAVSTIASGMYGIYLSARFLISAFRPKRRP
ncbi:MAG: hypothetical protein EPN97_03660 [Alphaproteobacteria bacterium]|nr:MAG: hypothetical protein EPN97_03660 [Alphaproteobacteria bacterium]